MQTRNLKVIKDRIEVQKGRIRYVQSQPNLSQSAKDALTKLIQDVVNSLEGQLNRRCRQLAMCVGVI